MSNALPKYATWNPSTSACAWSAGWGSPLTPASVSSVALTANVERIASPSAPPICCDVLKSPDARPASESGMRCDQTASATDG